MSNNGQEMVPYKNKNDTQKKSKRNPNGSRSTSYPANAPAGMTLEQSYISFPGGTAYLKGGPDDEKKEQPRRTRKGGRLGGRLEVTVHYVMKYDLIDILDTKEAILDFQASMGSRQSFQYVFEGVRDKLPRNLGDLWIELLVAMKERADVNKQQQVGQTERCSDVSKEQVSQTERCSDVSKEQEVSQIEGCSDVIRAFRKREIRMRDLFRTMPGQEKPVRSLLTIGGAGIGKTILAKKYVLDWARASDKDQEIKILIPFFLRDFNKIVGKNVTFRDVILMFFKELKGFNDFNKPHTMFILDGLEEFVYPLDFENNEVLTDIHKPAPIAVMLTSLINGHLLPLACIWVTARPYTAKRIPALERFDRVTELRGFTKPNREAYFKKRYSSDEDLASRMISHIRTSVSLQNMCHLPVFCWMTGTVLEHFFREDKEEHSLPVTVLEVYMHFLAIESKMVYVGSG